jgi:hypothetical protein
MPMRRSIAIAAVLAASLLHAAPGNAQALRTWVSGVGDDINPCSRTSRCKTFAGAISKTIAGGEISVLDPGGFGQVNIAKSISIVSVGAEGGIVAATGSTGITINAGPTDVVQLNGLVIEGIGTGATGIRIVAAGAVHIRNCLIRGFQAGAGLGIDIAPSAITKVFISNCAVTKNIGGIRVKPTGSGRAQVFLDHVHLENNAKTGLGAEGETAIVRLHASVITGNDTGIDIAHGSVISFGNNAIGGNQTDGAPSQVVPLQ